MATEILYKGRLPRSGHFTRVNFTNLMSYTLGAGLLSYEQEYGDSRFNQAGCFEWAEHSKSRFSKNAYHIKGGVVIVDSVKRRTPRHPYRRFVAIRGPSQRLREVKEVLQHVMDNIDYNNEPLPTDEYQQPTI